ncbi:MAG TPA: hypothetical protein PKE40_07680 [Arachnia sp.]|nr:hypothetical protein [Arachnia sp.]HMT86215.1 hypothetical protein [Arachnia sp.]
MAEDGFLLEVGDLRISGSAEVAEVGDRVTATAVAVPDELLALGLSGSALLDVKINDGGKQPARPIKLEWQVPEGTDPDMVAFITNPGENKPWQGIPVSVEGTTVTAELEHLSWIWFVRAGEVFKEFGKGVSQFLQQSFDKPTNCEDSATNNRGTYRLTSDNTRIYGCLEATDSDVRLALAPNSGDTWKVAAPTATAGKFDLPLSTSGIVVATMFKGLFQNRYAGVLQPGGRATLTFDAAGVDARGAAVRAEVDPGMGLVPIVIAGVDMLLTMHGVTLPGEKLVLIGECLAGSVDYLTASSGGEVAAAYVALAQCIIGAFEDAGFDGLGPLSVLLSIVGSLSGQLVTQVRGIGDQIFGGASVNFVITATPIKTPEQDPWRLTFKGFGPLRWSEPVPQEMQNLFENPGQCAGPIMRHPEYGTVEIWTDDGTVDTEVRVFILRDEQASTDSGVRIGMSLGELRKTHPELDPDPYGRQYGETDADIYYLADGAGHDGSLAFFFEVRDDTVVGISLQNVIMPYTTTGQLCGGSVDALFEEYLSNNE